MIRNYTSEVPASTSIGHILGRLVDHGANAIQQQFEEKRLVAITFIIPMPDGREIPIRIPARVKQIEVLLRKEIRKPTPQTHERITEQAQRTAWKLLDEWVEIQLALVKLEQIEFLEVFLPYVYLPSIGQTYYEQLKTTGFKQLALPAKGSS